jgi:tetratricopeptide (TPR) repeat protein
MSCARLENTALLLRGELGARDMEEAQAHLETCAICFGRLAMAAAELSDEEPPNSDPLQPDLVSWLARSGLVDPSAEPPSSARTSMIGLRFPPGATGSVGPYVIEGVLGHGGMGVVYRARHRDGGDAVALKTVSTPDLASFEGLRQEIRFLKDAHQPDIVRVLDYDLSAGDPWFAMELLEGETLADFHRALWGVHSIPPSSGSRPASSSQAAAGRLGEVLQIYLELCRPLNFIHRVGIVHCDLKPANVFLRERQHPVLMDFGLIVPARGAVDREALHPAVRRRGTLPYISPEVISGHIPDARADLYALGCMLYESVTGRPPFVASSRGELYDLHLKAPPLPASQLVSGVPPALDELLAKLLAKAPQDRMGHTYQVAEGLVAAGAPGSTPTSTSSPAYLFRSAIVGRAESLEVVTRALERAKRGTGTLVLVEGESGIGKTFFASEIAQRASLLGLRVVTGECQAAAYPSEGTGAALQGIRNFLDVVRDACRRGGPDVTERLLGSNLGILKQYSPALGGLPGADGYPEPAPLPDTAGRERLLTALLQTLREFGEMRPFVLILDDLQWADELTLALLDNMDTAFFTNTPLLLLGTRRSREGSKAIDRLLERSWVTSVRLERLAQEHTAAIIEQMLGVRSSSPALVEFISAQAEGVPFFVAEYLRTVLADGILSWRDGTWSLERQSQSLDATLRGVPFPKRLQELIRHRIGTLSGEAEAAVQAAAVLGREFEPTLLREVLLETDEHVSKCISEALANGVLEVSREGRPRFAHDKFREAVYAELEPARKRELHTRVARTLDNFLKDNPELEVRAGELAHHYELAANELKAIDYFERAGERALLVAADSDAIDHFRQAIRLESSLGARLPSIRRARWHRGVADAKQGLGQANDSVEHLSAAAALLGHPVPAAPWRQSVKLGMQFVLQVVRSLLGGVRRSRDAASLARYVEAGRVFERLQRASYYAGQTRPLLLGCITSLNLLESAGSARELATAYMNVAAVCGILPAPKQAARYFGKASEALRETPDPANESLLRLLQAVFYSGGGKGEEAIAMADQGIAIADLIGFHRRFNECTAVRAGVDIFAGRVQAARKGLVRLDASARLRGDVQMISWSNLQELECLIVEGNIPAASAQYRRLLANLPDARPEQVWAHCLGALALFRADDSDAARVALEGARHALADPPVHLHGVNAFDRLSQALIGLVYREPGKQGQKPELAKALRLVLRHLQRASRVFAIAQPMAALQLGTVEWLSGKRERAVKSWEHGLLRAQELKLPFHEARLARTLATALNEGDRSAALHASADAILEQLELPAVSLGGTLELLRRPS